MFVCAMTNRTYGDVDSFHSEKGLFDLRENLLGRALDDLRAIAA